MSEQDTGSNATVQVAYIDHTGQYLVSVDWHPELTALQALQQSGLLTKLMPEQPVVLGIFGVKIDVPENYLLQAGDRLELYRPLTRDPKDVRRKRAAAHPVGRLKRSL